MKLLIIRHAIAMDRSDFRAQFGGNDDLRPLTEKGIRKMKKNARGLSHLVARPDALIVSPLTRAVETAKILKLENDWPEVLEVSCESLRPEAHPSVFDQWLVDWLKEKSGESESMEIGSESDTFVAIVGHEPHLSRLVGWYLFGKPISAVQIKKGGACLLEITPGQCDGKLLWLLTPAQLRACR